MRRTLLAMALLTGLTFASGSVARASEDEIYHTVKLLHTAAEGFQVTSTSTGGVDTLLVHNGAVQFILKKDSSLPPARMSYGVEGENLLLTINAPQNPDNPQLVYGVSGCYEYPGRLIELQTESCSYVCVLIECMCEVCTVIAEDPGQQASGLFTLQLGPTP